MRYSIIIGLLLIMIALVWSFISTFNYEDLFTELGILGLLFGGGFGLILGGFLGWLYGKRVKEVVEVTSADGSKAGDDWSNEN